jgi:hypothetical protein
MTAILTMRGQHHLALPLSQDISQNAARHICQRDLDRICRVRYGADTGTDCNVQHDVVGNITQMPTRGGGTRIINYLAGAPSARSMMMRGIAHSTVMALLK